MRKIKFRAWEEQKNRMLTTDNTNINGEMKSWNYWGDCIFDDLYTDQFVIMQWTGLIDDNGKEIYDGDIVNYHNCHDVDEEGESINYYGIIEYNEHEAGYFIRCNSLGKPINECGSFEVVGNIYENPELINKK